MAIGFESEISANIPTPDAGFVNFFHESDSIKYKTSSGTVFTLSTGVTAEEVEDIVANLVVGGNGINIVYDDGGNTLTYSVEASEVDHNSLLNYNSNEHIDWTQSSAGTIHPSNYADNDTTDHTLLSNIGVNTHPQIDAHISSNTNPHSVTAAQTGAETTAQLDVRDTNNRNRSNHTGTQIASTITDFATTVTNTAAVLANTAKVSADGSVNTHSDVNTSGAVIGDVLQWNGSAYVPVAGVTTNVFGTEFETFIDTSTTNFTSNTQIQLRTETTASKPAGLYRVAVHVQLEPGSNGSNTNLNLRIDGTQIGLEYEDEGKDTGSDIRKNIYLFGYHTNPSVGSFDVEVWGDNQNTGTSVIHGHNFEIWRVS